MTSPRLPLSHLTVPPAWRLVVEKGRLVVHFSLWLMWPAALWLLVVGEWKLLVAGLLGATLMPFVLQLILLPAHILSRRHGRAEATGSAALTAIALAAWTWASAWPVLDRDQLPAALRLLWGYSVATLPLALMVTSGEDVFVSCVGAAQVQAGVLLIAVGAAGDLPLMPIQLALAILAALSTWAVSDAWVKSHPPKR